MNKQKGMTFIGMILTLAIVVILGVVVMRVVPVYIQHYSIGQSIHALNRIPQDNLSGVPVANARLLKDKLKNQFYINGIDVPIEKIKIVPDRKGGFQVFVNYKVIKPLVGNISLLFQFDLTKEVHPGGQ